MRYISSLVLTGMVLLQFVQVHSQTATPALIPYPASVKPAKGEFTITPGTGIVYDTKDGFDQSLAELSRLIPSGKSLPRPSTKVIELQKDAAITSAEGYQINISEQKVLLKAGSPAGMFRAVQTIRQL